MQRGRVNVLIDGQWGSTGKGKFAGLLALKHRPDLAVCNFMPNAGHTWETAEHGKVMTQQLPTSMVSPSTMLHIAGSAAIDAVTLLNEINKFHPVFGVTERLSIDPMVAIIGDDHKKEEQDLNRISSTTKGCGAALAHKVMRHTHDTISGSGSLPDFAWNVRVLKTEDLVHTALEQNRKVFFETAQGFDLSLNHGTKYPYTTSRDITVSQAMNDACVPPAKCGTVYGCLRTYPIRVGNAYELTGVQDGTNGWSGPYYGDQEELSWEQLQDMSRSQTPLLERTTVTNKVRRVFTFSEWQLERFIKFNNPTFLCLNFVNHLDSRAFGVSVWTPFDRRRFFSAFPKIQRFVEMVNGHGVPVAYLGTGPLNEHVVDLGIDE